MPTTIVCHESISHDSSSLPSPLGEVHLHPQCHAVICQAARPACPECKTLFADEAPSPIGEKAVPRTHDDFSSSKKKRKRPSRAAVNGDGEDEVDASMDASLEEEEREGPGSQSGDTGQSFRQAGAGPVSCNGN